MHGHGWVPTGEAVPENAMEDDFSTVGQIQPVGSAGTPSPAAAQHLRLDVRLPAGGGRSRGSVSLPQSGGVLPKATEVQRPARWPRSCPGEPLCVNFRLLCRADASLRWTHSGDALYFGVGKIAMSIPTEVHQVFVYMCYSMVFCLRMYIWACVYYVEDVFFIAERECSVGGVWKWDGNWFQEQRSMLRAMCWVQLKDGKEVRIS